MKIDPIDTAERVSLCVYAYRQINLKFQTNWKQQTQTLDFKLRIIEWRFYEVICS